MAIPVGSRPVLQRCYQYGGHIVGLKDDDGHAVDGVRLLWAIAGCESDYGRQAEFARHEAAYMPGGRYYQQALEQRKAWQRWGITAACSWGAWQLMAPTARELGYDGPPWGLADHDVCCHWATTLIVHRFIDGHGAKTLRHVLDAYNSGFHRDAVVPSEYINRGLQAYARELPPLL